MAKTKIARIRYVDEYEQAPKSAEFILRLSGSSLLLWLERYEGNYSYPIKEFDSSALFNEETFNEILFECRRIIGPSKTLWAEKPSWMREDYAEEF